MKRAEEMETVFRFFNEVGIIDQLVSAEFQRAIAPELGVSEFGVLNHFIRRGDGTTPTYLAKAFQITKPSMTAILGKLEKKGFVRVEAVPTDRRLKHVFLTDAGRDAHKRALSASAPLIQSVLADFGLERLQEALPMLQDLRIYLDDSRNERDGITATTRAE